MEEETMTRKEITLKLAKYADGAMIPIGYADNIVGEVFDYFSSRTCDSCRYVRFTSDAKDDTWCSHYMLEDINTSPDFYCAYWEKKQ